MFESEKETRWKRVDPLLKAARWTLVDFKEGLDFTKLTHHAIREFMRESPSVLPERTRFSATNSPVCRSRALNTSACPPRPSGLASNA